MTDNSQKTDQTVSMGDWILTMILTGIPLVGIIMIFVWAFGGGAKLSKRNYARAALIVALIGIVLGIFMTVVFGAIFATYASSLSDTLNNMRYS